MASLIRIRKANRIGVMSGDNPPAAYCENGDTVLFETEDCTDGAVRPDGTRDRTPGRYISNPATGPLYVNGAEPGDVLEVTVLSLKTGKTGFMGTGGREKVFGDKETDYPIRVFDVSEGTVMLGGHTFPVDPMIGVIGVAPAGEGIDTLTPLSHGGNMDCTRIREGAAVYLPVYVPGALLALGDLHAAMGDGETAWYGLETPGEVTVRVRVIKNRALRWPAVIDGQTFSVIASADTTDACCALATEQLYDILVEQGWDPSDALYLMSMKCGLRVCQIVDPKMTVRAEIGLEYILRP